MAQEASNVEAILSIDDTRRKIAWLFGHRGQEESRRKLLESDIRMLEQFSVRAGADPVIGLLAALARVELAPEKATSAELRAAIKRFPANRLLPQPLAGRIAQWIARDIQAYPSDTKSTGNPAAGLDPELHARTVIQTLDSKCEALGVYPAMVPGAAVQVGDIGYGRAARQRKAGRLEDARWTAAFLLAFGKVLVERDPREASFHLVLAEAYDQEAKNASKIWDVRAVEAATRNALVAASTAIRLDPRNTFARVKVAGLQDKMVDLASRRPPAQRTRDSR